MSVPASTETQPPSPTQPATPPPFRPPVSKHWRKIRSAAFVAAFNAATIGACAVLSLQFSLSMFSLVGLVVSVALAIFAYLEFRGRKRLLKLDPSACALLGWNQFAFMMLIVCYCVLQLIHVYRHPEFTMEYPGEKFLKRDDWDLFVEVIFDPYWGAIWKVTYFSIIVATILAQGGNAIYYFTRRKHVVAHLAEIGKRVES